MTAHQARCCPPLRYWAEAVRYGIRRTKHYNFKHIFQRHDGMPGVIRLNISSRTEHQTSSYRYTRVKHRSCSKRLDLGGVDT